MAASQLFLFRPTFLVVIALFIVCLIGWKLIVQPQGRRDPEKQAWTLRPRAILDAPKYRGEVISGKRLSNDLNGLSRYDIQIGPGEIISETLYPEEVVMADTFQTLVGAGNPVYRTNKRSYETDPKTRNLQPLQEENKRLKDEKSYMERELFKARVSISDQVEDIVDKALKFTRKGEEKESGK